MLSLIILRRSVCLNRLIQTPYEKITAETKEQIKIHVLEILNLDLGTPFKEHVIDLVGNLAASVISESKKIFIRSSFKHCLLTSIIFFLFSLKKHQIGMA